MKRYITLLVTLHLFLSVFTAKAAQVPVTILYTSDTHGYVVSSDTRIGLDRIAAIKNRSPDSLLLDAGDFLQGTPLAAVTKGRDIVALMKKTGYFAAAVGNHEFDYGLVTLAARTAEAEAEPNPVHLLSANVYGKNGPLFTPWANVLVGGAKICVFGLTTPETKTRLVDPAIVGKLAFTDPDATASAMARMMRASNCDAVIALTHLGSGDEIPLKSTELPAVAPEIDVVIDGHSHIVVTRETDHGLVVSPGAHAERLGKLQLVVDTGTHKVVRAENSFLTAHDAAAVAGDATVAAMIETMRQSVERLDETVGELPTALPGSRDDMRVRETPLGNVTADAFRAAYGCDVAIVNSGGIRSGLPKGRVSRKDILTAFPFPGQVVMLSVSGRELCTLLEHGFSRLPGADGAFPQISGVVVRLNRNAAPGKRVAAVTLPDGSPLVPGKTYTLATNTFMASGGDGYPLLKEKKILRSDTSVENAVITHIRKTGKTTRPSADPSRIIDAVPPPDINTQ